MKRREAREAAFVLIFEKLFRTDSMEAIIAAAEEGNAYVLDHYSKRLVLLVEEHDAKLDILIEKYLNNWKLVRLPRVTHAILQLAFCELAYFPDIPVRVSINEAIELAKKYGTEEDASYINGVLGSYVKEAVFQKDETAAEDESEACKDI